MTLFHKIIALYPELAMTPSVFYDGTISLQNDSDDRGDYIKTWNHPTLSKPTDEQLAAATAS